MINSLIKQCENDELCLLLVFTGLGLILF